MHFHWISSLPCISLIIPFSHLLIDNTLHSFQTPITLHVNYQQYACPFSTKSKHCMVQLCIWIHFEFNPILIDHAQDSRLIKFGEINCFKIAIFQKSIKPMLSKSIYIYWKLDGKIKIFSLGNIITNMGNQKSHTIKPNSILPQIITTIMVYPNQSTTLNDIPTKIFSW